MTAAPTPTQPDTSHPTGPTATAHPTPTATRHGFCGRTFYLLPDESEAEWRQHGLDRLRGGGRRRRGRSGAGAVAPVEGRAAAVGVADRRPSGDLAFRHSTFGEYLAGHAVARDSRHLKRADKRPVQACVLFAPEHRGSRTTPSPAKVA